MTGTLALPRPMLAKAVDVLPEGGSWWYEPKWDGFRCIAGHLDGDAVLGSRNDKPLTRYFPELVDAVREAVPDGTVLDGEIVVPVADRLDWEALSARIHPAASRIDALAARTPAVLVVFDLLAVGGRSLLAEPLHERRRSLEQLMGRVDHPRLASSVGTADRETAQDWFVRFEGAGLDGVIAKDLDEAYRPDARGFLKLKHRRSADVVVLGYREHRSSTPEAPLVGSLLLGLHADDGELVLVGGASAFTAARRAELVQELAPLVDGRGETERSRWTGTKDVSFVRLRPERVCEVEYDQLQGSRFRHTVRFLRWRPDRDPASCRFDQVETPVRYSLDEVMRGRSRA